MFSGLYPHTHKLQGNVYGVDDVLAHPEYKMSVVWPGLLKQAGYYTAYIGKWHLGEKAPACFDEWKGYNSLQPHWVGKRQESQYRPEMETDQAIEFLRHNKARRFALCVSYYPPHTPYDPPQKYTAMYEKTALQPAAYWGAVTAIDACVGRLMAQLDALGLGQQTLVLFTADHGDHFGKRPRRFRRPQVRALRRRGPGALDPPPPRSVCRRPGAHAVGLQRGHHAHDSRGGRGGNSSRVARQESCSLRARRRHGLAHLGVQ